MKILIIGDGFVKVEIVKPQIESYLSPLKPLEFKTCTFDWPLSPFISNDEISEYEGDEEIVKKHIEDVEILLIHGAPVTAKVLDAAVHLKAIGVVRGGPTNINIAEATKRGIPVFYSPGRNAQAVVEFTIGLLLSECRHIARSHKNLMEKEWAFDYYAYEKCGVELKGKTIGLVGFGNISWRLAPVLVAIGMNVVSADPFVSTEKMASFGVKKVSLEELFTISDVISVHARLTEDTRYMFNRKTFSQMKKGVIFVNTARGGLVNYDDLTEALDSGQVGSAALDVFPSEPADLTAPLFQRDNVTITPHIAGATKDSVTFGMKNLLESILSYFVRGELINCMNPKFLQK
jgi:D-3-phosphoglycerate dehydrogenase